MFGWGPQTDSPTRAKEMKVEKEDIKKSDDQDVKTEDRGDKSKKVSDEAKESASRR